MNKYLFIYLLIIMNTNIFILSVVVLTSGYLLGKISETKDIETISWGGIEKCSKDNQCQGAKNFCRQGFCTNLSVDESLSIKSNTGYGYGSGNAIGFATKNNYQTRNEQIYQQCLLSKGLSDAGQRVECAMDFAKYNAIAELVGN